MLWLLLWAALAVLAACKTLGFSLSLSQGETGTDRQGKNTRSIYTRVAVSHADPARFRMTGLDTTTGAGLRNQVQTLLFCHFYELSPVSTMHQSDACPSRQ